MRISNIRDFRVGHEYTMTLNGITYILRCTRIELPEIGTYTVFFGYDGLVKVDRNTLKNFNLEEVI